MLGHRRRHLVGDSRRVTSLLEAPLDTTSGDVRMGVAAQFDEIAGGRFGHLLTCADIPLIEELVRRVPGVVDIIDRVAFHELVG